MMPAPFRTVEISDPDLESDGLRWMTVKSAALRRRTDLSLWVPEEGRGRAMPLVVLLHGVYGSHWAWALKGAAHRTAAALIRSGEIPPMVLAMPSDGLWGDDRKARRASRAPALPQAIAARARARPAQGTPAGRRRSPAGSLGR